METLPLSEVKAKLSELVTHVVDTDDRIVVTRKGRAVAILMSQEDFDSWTETMAILSHPRLMKEIREGIKALRHGPRRRCTVGELFGE